MVKFLTPNDEPVYIRVDQVVIVRPSVVAHVTGKSPLHYLTDVVTTAGVQAVQGTVDEVIALLGI